MYNLADLFGLIFKCFEALETSRKYRSRYRGIAHIVMLKLKFSQDPNLLLDDGEDDDGDDEHRKNKQW